MINTDLPHNSEPEDEALERVLRSGPRGAFLLAGLTTAIVLALWVAFYFLVFIPHANP
ncbi:hypothetical protein P9272_02060 [Mesorhizobium sp. WSM4976]|uniref:hypothetical protein n=1 Tax=Mesorhizobium sp. WSM4976 TaxID=3038549 RepID=UPI002416A6B5|nr:hypothetical protein [Mesorhizobium sp. WSM4976]MDG4892387.1 hypothetical protein [Mesorhizobium sp. WSM4976]